MLGNSLLAAAFVAASVQAQLLPPPQVCTHACFPKDHICTVGQFLLPPPDGGDCYTCCKVISPPPPQRCLMACFGPDHVCAAGQYLRPPAEKDGCYLCCELPIGSY
ncbi:hypothetical protein ONZ45_g1099 [Pleurotus djamor]|nr:hypothetical protein ONZ45_g1099 [Pleurotus djamor]